MGRRNRRNDGKPGLARGARGAVLVATLAAAFGAPPPADAGRPIYTFTGPDGVVHFTDAPRDRRYRELPAPKRRRAMRPPQRREYDGLIGLTAREHEIEPALIKAVIAAESNFDPEAVSRKGAQGLMQLMPATASQLGVRNAFDIVENIDGGVRHLRGLIERFANNLPLALAAYNAGEKAVQQHGGIPPYPETEQYVARILGIVGGQASAASGELSRTPMYQYVESDGATVYTNIPRRRR
jgi:soluble lytic murein transglycosylase-like protein